MSPPSSSDSPFFATTRWSVVLATGPSWNPTARQAFAELCQSYWYPLYAYLRRRSYSHDDASDLTQSFLASLFEKEGLRNANPQRGRFRGYLLGALKNFVSDQHEAQNALKRGGGVRLISLDLDDEKQTTFEPSSDETPERAFDREWAQIVLQKVMDRLEEELRHAGKEELFQATRPHLIGNPEQRYQEIADQFDITVQATKVMVHRMRKRFRELLRMEIADTVSSSEEIDDEIRQLFVALG